MDAGQVKQLREPFPPEQVGKLPKVSCSECAKVKGGAPWDRHCAKHEAERCKICGAFVTTAHDHLDFVGHGHTTGRLLDVDPEWSWAPVAYGQDGLPQLDQYGGLWMTLTIAGVTRLGYGDAGSKTGPNAIKEAIGDGIRNSAMRFGVALDLWAREHATEETEPSSSPRGASRSPARASTPAAPTAPATPPADEHVLSTADLKLPPSARYVVTKPQIKKMWGLAHGFRLSDDQVREIMRQKAGVEHSDQIERRYFDAVLKEIEDTGMGTLA